MNDFLDGQRVSSTPDECPTCGSQSILSGGGCAACAVKEVMAKHPEIVESMKREAKQSPFIPKWARNKETQDIGDAFDIPIGAPDSPDAQTTQQSTGAVRSSDADRYDFTSMPWLGILAVARTAKEGTKYGRFNYLRGFPVHDLLEHVQLHLALYYMGEGTIVDLAHAAWGLLVAIQESILRPEENKAYRPGPGMTMPPEMLAYMKEMDPILKAKREAGEFAHLANWKAEELPEVVRLLEKRKEVWDGQ